jgi:hypothetical protein
LTRTPESAASAAAVRVSSITALCVSVVGARLMMQPPPARCIDGISYFIASAISPGRALLNAASSRPNAPSVCSTSRRTDTGLAMSVGTATTSPPAEPMAAASASRTRPVPGGEDHAGPGPAQRAGRGGAAFAAGTDDEGGATAQRCAHDGDLDIDGRSGFPVRGGR